MGGVDLVEGQGGLTGTIRLWTCSPPDGFPGTGRAALCGNPRFSVPRNPGYNGDMNAKARYRLQQQLQAALARVVEVLAQFEKAQLDANVKSLLLAAGVADALGSLV